MVDVSSREKMAVAAAGTGIAHGRLLRHRRLRGGAQVDGGGCPECWLRRDVPARGHTAAFEILCARARRRYGMRYGAQCLGILSRLYTSPSRSHLPPAAASRALFFPSATALYARSECPLIRTRESRRSPLASRAEARARSRRYLVVPRRAPLADIRQESSVVAQAGR